MALVFWEDKMEQWSYYQLSWKRLWQSRFEQGEVSSSILDIMH